LAESQAELGRMMREVTESSFSCERIALILDEPIRVASQPTSLPVVLQEGRVAFEGVSFRYGKENRQPVFEDLEASISGGAFVALAGASGCGKTTLCYLMARLFDPWHGRVLIDGCDVRQMEISFLKEQIGMALQETFLWNDTIAANIRYGRPQASREEVRLAGRLAGVEAIVAQMPQGYETVIGENACKVSEGQKQKIAIARSLVKKPKILILDEAMSHMDSLSEERILSDIRRAYPTMTLVVVSHRLSCVLQADTVLYMKSVSEIVSAPGRAFLEKDRDFAALFGGQAG
jgi:ABC-type multidrug transport system fused ATPase/permease subunit